KTPAIVCARLDSAKVLDALVPVQVRRDQSKRCAVFVRKRLALESIGEENLPLEQILQQNAGRVSIERFEFQIVTFRARARARNEERMIEIPERVSAPGQGATRPSRHAVEIGDDFFSL